MIERAVRLRFGSVPGANPKGFGDDHRHFFPLAFPNRLPGKVNMGASSPSTRRQFLAGSATALGAVILTGCDAAEQLTMVPENPAFARAQKGTLTFFIDESGVFGRGPLFVVGAVHSTDIALHEGELQSIRRNVNPPYSRELRYATTDVNKVRFARAAIDYFLRTPGLGFQALVTSDPPAALDRADLYAQLIQRVPSRGADVAVELEQRSPRGPFLGPDAELAAELDRRFDVGFQRPHRKSDLMQLADLFVGSIHEDVVEGVRRPTSPKLALIEHLKAGLGVSSLTDPRLARTSFQVSAPGHG